MRRRLERTFQLFRRYEADSRIQLSDPLVKLFFCSLQFADILPQVRFLVLFYFNIVF